MDSSSVSNIAAYLPRMAESQPETTAVHFPTGRDREDQTTYRSYSYRELDRHSDRIAAGLAAYGIGRGVRTVLMVKPSLDFFALTFALFKVGAVPVLIDPGMGIRNLKSCLEEAEPEAFIGIPAAHLARLLFGWGRKTLQRRVTVGRRLFWGGTTLRRLIARTPESRGFRVAATRRDETAAILFTSGSTGPPKGAVYTHGNFLAQVRALQEIYTITPGEIDLPTFPLFALFAPALGMTSVIPEMDFTRPGAVDPVKIVSAIRRFNATTMFGSPALIRRVGDYGAEHKIKLPSLKRAISAGAPVPAPVLERFGGMLDGGCEVFTPYGATESLPVCSIGSREILAETRHATDHGKGVCVGLPVPGIRLEIIRISDAPVPSWEESLRIPDGETGEIIVQGEQVTHSYFNRPEATTLAKIADPETGGFFHRMGDLGYRDSSGRIWFCGRKAHRVETERRRFFTIPCEAVFNTHPQVFRTALVGVTVSGNIQPLICVELEPGAPSAAAEAILAELGEIGREFEHTRDISLFLIHPGFPVDIRHNAKIFREKLAVWAREQLS